MANTGSWLGLPDFGITEAIGSTLFGGSITGQGGSDIFKNNPSNLQDSTESWTNPTLNSQYNQNAAYQPGVNSPQVSANYALQNNLKADQLTQKDVQPINVSGGGGNASSQDDIINAYKKMGWTDVNAILADYKATGGSKLNTGGSSGGDNSPAPFNLKSTNEVLGALGGAGVVDNDMEGYFNQLKAAAQAGDQAAIDQLNQVFGQQEETLNTQYGQAEKDQGIAEQELANQLKGIETEIESQKTKASESVMTESEKAAEAARSAQRQNRNIMRALGILGSTYAAEALQNPMNELAKQKATFAKWGMDQIASLDQTLLQKKDEANVAKQKIMSQYASIKEKIQSDIRYNQQQKATSLQALKAGAQQNLATIQGQMVSYQQQLEQQKLGFTTQIAQILLNKNPNADLASIMATAQKTTGQLFPQSQQVATVSASPDRKTLSGFSMDNYQGWDKASAYQDWLAKNKNNSLNA